MQNWLLHGILQGFHQKRLLLLIKKMAPIAIPTTAATFAGLSTTHCTPASTCFHTPPSPVPLLTIQLCQNQACYSVDGYALTAGVVAAVWQN